MKQTKFYVQMNSLRDYSIFSGISENEFENPINMIKDFMWTKLKLPSDTVESIIFYWSQHLRVTAKAQSITAKFQHYYKRSCWKVGAET